MRFLKAIVLVLSLILAACEGALSPTEPQQIEVTSHDETGPGPERNQPSSDDPE